MRRKRDSRIMALNRYNHEVFDSSRISRSMGIHHGSEDQIGEDVVAGSPGVDQQQNQAPHDAISTCGFCSNISCIAKR